MLGTLAACSQALEQRYVSVRKYARKDRKAHIIHLTICLNIGGPLSLLSFGQALCHVEDGILERMVLELEDLFALGAIVDCTNSKQVTLILMQVNLRFCLTLSPAPFSPFVTLGKTSLDWPSSTSKACCQVKAVFVMANRLLPASSTAIAWTCALARSRTSTSLPALI